MCEPPAASPLSPASGGRAALPGEVKYGPRDVLGPDSALAPGNSGWVTFSGDRDPVFETARLPLLAPLNCLVMFSPSMFPTSSATALAPFCWEEVLVVDGPAAVSEIMVMGWKVIRSEVE